MNDPRSMKGEGPALWALLDAARIVETRLDAALETLGLSKGKFTILAQLARASEPLPLSALADKCSCVRSNVTQLVDRLEADGLVRRVDDALDRRSVRAELTREGRERQRKAERVVEALEEEMREALPAQARAALARLAGF
jgi:DNA-binding MarR family transcriptional regulator